MTILNFHRLKKRQQFCYQEYQKYLKDSYSSHITALPYYEIDLELIQIRFISMILLDVNPYDCTYPPINNITNTSSSFTILYFTSKANILFG